MIARLTVHLPRQPTKTLLARAPRDYEVGREAGCDLVLDDPRVSRRHARLSHSAEGWTVTDLGSKNGLLVDGEAVEQALLAKPCWLSFGGLMSRFEPLTPDSPWARERSRRRQTSLDAHRGLKESGEGGEALLQRLLASVLEITGAERGFVLLAGSGEPTVVSIAGSARADAPREAFEGSSSAVRRALESGEVIAESDVVDDSVLSGQPSVLAGGIRGLVCLPLEAAGERLGAIYADSTKPGTAFDELDLEILEALTSHAALALWVASVDRELLGMTSSLPTAFVARDSTASPEEVDSGPEDEPRDETDG